jgi:hypothetical protein
METATLTADWVRIGNHLGVDWTSIDVNEWVKGCDHELEHWETVGGNPLTIARIALDHLSENPKYYQMLEKVENDS